VVKELIMSYYHILSLDGGGIRGVLTARLMERLEGERPGWLGNVDLLSGTSTGGILALGLASGLSPAEARTLYEACGREVFKDTKLDDMRDLKYKNFPSMLGADYNTEPLKDILTAQFGQLRLGELHKKVLIPTFDLDNEGKTSPRTWKAKFFHNFEGEDTDTEELVVDVAIRTSAAPTYFPIYQGYVDGGVVVNNPALCALAQAMHEDGAERSLSQIVVMSLGTGFSPRFVDLKDPNADWGLVKWAPHIISMMMDGAAGVVEYQCRQLLKKRFLRLNPELMEKIDLDRIDFIPRLVEIADGTDLKSCLTWMDRYLVEKEPAL
jgi:uncharacterized protein